MRDRPETWLRPVAGPASEPVTLAEAKRHLRVEWSDDDAYIEMAIATARRRVEAETRRFLVGQTWDLTLDRFPCGAIVIPRPPLYAVGPVAVRDDAGEYVTVDPTTYTAIVGAPDRPGLILPRPGKSWPSTSAHPEAVRVRFVGGYGMTAAMVPEPFRWAILLLIGHYFENREAVTSTSANELPRGVSDLLASVSWGYYPR